MFLLFSQLATRNSQLATRNCHHLTDNKIKYINDNHSHLMVVIIMTVSTSTIELWEQHTLKGDQLFHSKQYAQAFQRFEQAVTPLLELMHQPKLLDACAIRCFVLGCQNAGYCAELTGQRHVAEQYHRLCLSSLERLIKQSKAQRFKTILAAEASSAYVRFCRFLQQNPSSGTNKGLKFETDGGVSPLVKTRQSWFAKPRLSLLFF